MGQRHGRFGFVGRAAQGAQVRLSDQLHGLKRFLPYDLLQPAVAAIDHLEHFLRVDRALNGRAALAFPYISICLRVTRREREAARGAGGGEDGQAGRPRDLDRGDADAAAAAVQSPTVTPSLRLRRRRRRKARFRS